MRHKTTEDMVTALAVFTGFSEGSCGQDWSYCFENYVEFLYYIAEIGASAESEHTRRCYENNHIEPGVWCYEVAEELGRRLAKYMIENKEYASFDWLHHLEQLNDRFYSK